MKFSVLEYVKDVELRSFIEELTKLSHGKGKGVSCLLNYGLFSISTLHFFMFRLNHHSDDE